MLQVPILLIAFNRPDLTLRILDRLRSIKPGRLYVAVDGARPGNPTDAQKCQEVRELVDREVDWNCYVTRLYQDRNLGCKHGVSTAISWFFEQEEQGIILEDDTLPDPSFFPFCEELLARFADNNSIAMISGDNFQAGQRRGDYSYYFSHYTHIWGWASWRRAWANYDIEMQHWPEIRDKGLVSHLLGNNSVTTYWESLFERVYRGEIDTWDYQWTFACWLNSMLTILPQSNLVSNIGFRADATHTTEHSPFACVAAEPLAFPLRNPPYIIRDASADRFTERNVFNIGAGSAAITERLGTSTRDATPMVELPNLTKISAIPSSFPTLRELDQKPFESTPLPGEVPTKRHQMQAQPNLEVATLLSAAIEELQASRVEQALALVIQAKQLKVPTYDLDYVRALCFVNLGRIDDAHEALKEEMRHFPSNEPAKALLAQVMEHTAERGSKIADSEFQQVLALIRPYTMLSEERLYSLFTLAKRICNENTPGNFVECGVAAGGSSALLAYVIKRYSRQPRWLYAFDSFSGMPAPTAHDTYHGVAANATGWGTGTCAAPEASLEEVCRKLGVWDVVRPVKGYFEQTLPHARDKVGMLSLLHLDGDWYESTKAILESLYDRLVKDAYLQVDDYGYWEGCKKALHEFEAKRGISFAINQIDGTGVWFKSISLRKINNNLPKTIVEEFEVDDPVEHGLDSQMSTNERFQLYYAIRCLLPKTSIPARFIEIGCHQGASLFQQLIAFSRDRQLVEGFAVEPYGGPQFYEILRLSKDVIRHLKMFSHAAASELKEIFERDGHWPELVLVDGDHSYEGVKQDIMDYYPLLAPGGLIIFHDFLPALNDQNREAIHFHHANTEPGIRQACTELLDGREGCKLVELPLLYPDDPTQTQAHLPIIHGVYSTIRVYRKER